MHPFTGIPRGTWRDGMHILAIVALTLALAVTGFSVALAR
jgi:hypothetical protein